MIAMNLLAACAFLIGVACTVNKPTGEIGDALSTVRELHCEEDEQIVIDFAPNGLFYGFCEQVIER